MFQLGALAAFEDWAGPPFLATQADVYVGTSAGSVVASLLANGIAPAEICRGIAQGDGRLDFRRRDIAGLAVGSWARAVRRAVALVPHAFRAWRISGGLPSIPDALAALQEALPSGILESRRLGAFLRRIYAERGGSDDFRRLRAKLFVTATDLDTGDRRVFGADGDDQIPISLAVRASCALPVLFEPVEIEGRDYVDGGVRRVAHLDLAIRAGARLLLVFHPAGALRNDRTLVCLPTPDGHCATIREKGAVSVAEQSERILNDVRLALDLHLVEHARPRVRLAMFQPDPQETAFYLQTVLTFRGRGRLIAHGYRLAADQIRREDRSLRRLMAPTGAKPDLSRMRADRWASAA